MKKYCVHLHSLLASFCLSILLVSCAQVVSPTGGEKDVTPPLLTKSEPLNSSVHFHGKKIQLNFNEYIKVKDLNNQLIISPPLKKIPETNVKNKTLTLELKDTLKPHTTYTFSFGNSIVDYTEENPLENFQFVLSTGDYLDSITVEGKIEKAFNHAVEKGVLVMLYAIEKTSTDSFPYHILPDYFGKTNEFGNYKISNIKAGAYKLFALKDGNANYLFDSDEEPIAFLDSVVDIHKNLQIDMSLFQEQKSKLYLKKPVRLYDGQLICAFSKPAENLSFEPLNASQKFSWKGTEITANKDSARFWFAGPNSDSLLLLVLNNGLVFDTVRAVIPKLSAARDRKRLTVLSNISSNGSFDLDKKIILIISQPVKNLNRSKIVLINRKDTLKFEFAASDSLKRKFELAANLVEDSTYRLWIPPGTFEAFDGLKNDTVQLTFRMLSQRDYGTLKLAVKLREGSGNAILQMLDENEHILNERFLNKSEILFYEYVKPQKYKFKLIQDTNKNKKWDSGKFLEKRQAETTYYFPQTLTIRANWDLEEKWDLTK